MCVVLRNLSTMFVWEGQYQYQFANNCVLGTIQPYSRKNFRLLLYFSIYMYHACGLQMKDWIYATSRSPQSPYRSLSTKKKKKRKLQWHGFCCVPLFFFFPPDLWHGSIRKASILAFNEGKGVHTHTHTHTWNMRRIKIEFVTTLLVFGNIWNRI